MPLKISRPNVIWIFGDQHRAQALGCNGDPNLHTPNLDRLGAEGVNFTRALMGAPLCCPCRGSLLTSLYPHQCVPGHEHPLPPNQPTLAQTLGENGYHTAYFGKWHLDGWHETQGRAAFHHVPRRRRGGFDSWIGYENNNSPWDCHVHGHDSTGEREMSRLPGFETDALTDLLIHHLGDRTNFPDQPFFAALSVQPPHNPYAAPEAWMARHTPAQIQLRQNVPNVDGVTERARRDLAGYYAMIENLDWNVGRIRDALYQSGQWQNTHIVFFSDHGDMHGSHGQFLKTSPWEESVRVPFIIGGGVPFYELKVGQCDAPINHVDVAPTTLGLCGIDAPDWMRGTDYSGERVRDRAVKAPDSAFLQMVIPTGHGDSVDRPWRGVVTRDGWKYAVLEGQPWLMFDLNQDPLEQVNLAHNMRFGNKRRQLQERLMRWIDETGDAFALPSL